MPLEVITMIDLKLYERFDAATGMQGIRVGKNEIYLLDPGEKLGDSEYAIYISKDRTRLALKPDTGGYAIVRRGRNGTQRALRCPAVCNVLSACGVQIPQSANLAYDDVSGT